MRGEVARPNAKPVAQEPPKRGCRGCLFSVVHSVRSLLARGVAGASSLSDCLVADFALAHPGHCCTRGFGPYQRTFFATRAIASRTARHLNGSLLSTC